MTLLLIESLLIGLCIGSFLNVVVYRLPQMMLRAWAGECREFLTEQAAQKKDYKENHCPLCASSSYKAEQTQSEPFNLAVPRSRCPSCQNPIPAWANIPVISYLFLRGRCKNCQCKISCRYPLVELITGLTTMALTWHFGLTLALAASLIFAYGLIVVTLIDLDHQFIPDEVTYVLLWAGLLFNSQAVFTPLYDAVIGAAAGYLSLWTVYQLFKLATGKEGMGYGDFKLLAMLGAWCGWQQLPFIILFSSLLGSIIGLTMIVRGQHKDVPFAFGPYLAIAGFTALFYGEEVTMWYLSQF